MSKDTVAKYVVNIDDIKILMDKLSNKTFEVDYHFKNSLVSENFICPKGENKFFIPLQKSHGRIIKIGFILKDFLLERNELSILLDDKVIMHRKPILNGKMEYVFPESIEYSYSRLEFQIDCNIDTEFAVFVYTKDDVFEEIVPPNNCIINYRDSETEEILHFLEFLVPKEKEFTFIPQPFFSTKILSYIGQHNIQKLDKYGFNVSVPEFDDKLIFDFYYKEMN